jgi:hypothetical protein
MIYQAADDLCKYMWPPRKSTATRTRSATV